MMAERRIETSIEIEAPPEQVWAILTDFAGMAAWNPFIRSVSGALATGSRLSVHIAPGRQERDAFHAYGFGSQTGT
jgi:uncharacterized protein YndB with AHSA1/START domain